MIRAKNFRVDSNRITASFGGSRGGGIQQGQSASGAQQSTSYLLGADLKEGILSGVLDDTDPQMLMAVYKDIYMHDPICGAVIDLKSSLPWSSFTLTGYSESKLQHFYDTVERMGMISLLPELNTDYNALGAFVGTIIYDETKRQLTDIMPYSVADCSISSTPLYNSDPVIDLNVPEEIQIALKDKTGRFKHVTDRIPASMRAVLERNKTVELVPLTTMYTPRTSMTHIQVGVSILRRVLPIYLLERVLFRGTLSEATKRQRSTLHVQAGDIDWEPTIEELNSIIGLFQSTESDPLSSIVATRNAVTTQEIRQGGDFWKWTDNINDFEDMKMKALGVNESFLSGDSNYNTMEKAMDVFLDNLRTERQRLTQMVFYNKLFPLVSIINDLKVSDKTTETAASKSVRLSIALDKMMSGTDKLMIPDIVWHKQLKPEADTDKMEILEALEEKGIPVGLRAWAAAGGLSIEKVEEGLKDDVELRARLEKAKGGGNNEDTETSGFGVTKQSWMSRDFGEYSEVSSLSKTGKKKWIYNQKAANRQQNNNIQKALRSLSG